LKAEVNYRSPSRLPLPSALPCAPLPLPLPALAVLLLLARFAAAIRRAATMAVLPSRPALVLSRCGGTAAAAAACW
jgi:hypothetical protein